MAKYVISEVKGYMDGINAQLERQFSTGVKERPLQCTVSHQTEASQGNLTSESVTNIDTAFLDMLT